METCTWFLFTSKYPSKHSVARNIKMSKWHYHYFKYAQLLSMLHTLIIMLVFPVLTLLVRTFPVRVMRCNNNEVCPIDVLWNGDQCVGEAWFYRSLDQPTTDDIEMRVCRSQNQFDEDFRINLVELYIR